MHILKRIATMISLAVVLAGCGSERVAEPAGDPATALNRGCRDHYDLMSRSFRVGFNATNKQEIASALTDQRGHANDLATIADTAGEQGIASVLRESARDAELSARFELDPTIRPIPEAPVVKFNEAMAQARGLGADLCEDVPLG